MKHILPGGCVLLAFGIAHLCSGAPGDLRWQLHLGTVINGAPALSTNGDLLVTSDGRLYAVSTNGVVQWTFEVPRGKVAGPAVADDGTIYFGADSVYALNPQGSLIWRYAESELSTGPYHYFSDPVLGADGAIYANGTNLVGATNSALVLSDIKPNDTGEYRVIVGDECGSIASREASMVVLRDQPYILKQPANTSAIEGSEARFEVKAFGTPPLFHQWFHNGSLLTGATQDVLQLPATSASDAGLYSVRVSNGHGTIWSDEAMLRLNLADMIIDNSAALVTGTWHSGSHSSQIGTNYLYTSVGWGSKQARFVPDLPRPGLYAVSIRSLTPLPLFQPPPYVIHRSQGSHTFMGDTPVGGWMFAGAFHFERNAGASVAALDIVPGGGLLHVDAVRFTYQPVFPVVTSQPTGTNVLEGVTVVLSVAADGGGLLTYQWQLDQVNLPGAIGSSISIPSIQRSQGGRYRVLVSSPDGAVYSQEALVRVVAPMLRPYVENGALVLQWDGVPSKLPPTPRGPSRTLPAPVVRRILRQRNRSVTSV